jgi:hypothetical protein
MSDLGTPIFRLALSVDAPGYNDSDLCPFLAGRAEVWFDDRIEPSVHFKQEIQQKLKDTSIFIAVVSPSYLESEYCIPHELGWFTSASSHKRQLQN